jgi:polygalacturonase
MTITRRIFIGLCSTMVPVLVLPHRGILAQGTPRDVRRFGAAGDGVRDDTSAFERALADLPSLGGTVRVPAGTYRIDVSKGVALRSNVRLEMERDAVLVAAPTHLERYSVIRIADSTNVEIVGGAIVGERDLHLGDAGEHGMGINVRGARGVRIEGVRVSKCWGDGIYIGAGAGGQASANVRVVRCTSFENRRLGLAITCCEGALVEECEFWGSSGTAPQSGIDIEPNPGNAVSDVVIRGCIVRDNVADGISVHAGKGTIRGVRVTDNQIIRNGRSGIGLKGGVSGCVVANNRIELSGRNGILVIGGASRNEIVENVCVSSSQRRGGTFDNVRIERGCADNLLRGNRLSSGRGTARPRYGIHIRAGARGTRLERNEVERGTRGAIHDAGRSTTRIP